MQTIKANLDRIEEDTAILKTTDGNVSLPAKYLLNNFKEGDVLYLTIQSDEKKTDKEKVEAKNILNEILNANDE